MTSSYKRLVQALRRLPGVGPKQAERLALHVLRAPQAEVEELSSALLDAKAEVRTCRRCFNYCEKELCPLCSDPGRDEALLCVVEQPTDVEAVERTRSFRGLYHVLHGALSPLDGVGPDRIRVKELLQRLEAERETVREAIVATDPDNEGEATAAYLSQALRPFGIKVSRLAQGLPMGGSLGYADELTLSMAFNARRDL